MYAIIYYLGKEAYPRPYIMNDGMNDGLLHTFDTIEDADTAAFTLEEALGDNISCVVISIAPVDENAQD